MHYHLNMFQNLICNLRYFYSKQKRQDMRFRLSHPDIRSIPPRPVPAIVNTKAIPIYIISYDRLSYVMKLTEFLEKRNFSNIHIIDNCSTYPPLLEFLHTTKHTVHFMDKNYGYKVFWSSGKFCEVQAKQHYVVTDCDVLPTDECPDDFMDVFVRLLYKFPVVAKVGFALKRDDIHECYRSSFRGPSRELVANDMSLELYDSPLDTTFCLYRPSVSPRPLHRPRNFFRTLQVDGKYAARHLPWYTPPEQFTEEDKYYITHSSEVSYWARFHRAESHTQ